LPLIAPGIVAAGMLSFRASLDDFIITLFNGSEVTYPVDVMRKRAAPRSRRRSTSSRPRFSSPASCCSASPCCGSNAD
jgi:hypothetical protein